MKKITSIVPLLFVFGLSKAQIVPNNGGVPTATQTVATVPSAYSNTIKLNVVRTWEAQIPYTTSGDVTNSSRTAAQIKQTTAYFDGLGRPIQSIVKQASPNLKDIVSMHVYDAFGREQLSYLPYVQTASGTNTNDGLFKLNPFANQATFMSGQFSGESVFYNQTVFEESPLRRPLKTMAAGNSWAGSNRGIAMSYEISEANEVRIFNITQTIGAVPTTTTYYAQGELSRTVTTDEHNKRVVEYKDKTGLVILKKVEITTGATITSHTGWLCTYYVYDDVGMLRFVIPPLATQKLAANGWDFAATPLNNAVSELCFRYEYDAKGRMIIKKVPGAGEVYMIYDAQDRLYLMQDANLRNTDQWIQTLYDNLNRPTQTWLIYSCHSRVMLQAIADDPYIEHELCFPYLESLLLSETYYDNYSWATGISGISSTLDNSFSSSTDYISSTHSSPHYAESFTASPATTGMPTGTKVRILGTSNFTYSLTIYDAKGKPIQVQSTNHTGGTDIVSTQYDFGGKILRTHHKHVRASGVTPIQTTSLFTYDHGGRVLTLQKRINSGALKTITYNTYNELGQLQTKELGYITSSSEYLETLNHSYNIRGWLTGINKDYANSTSEDEASHKFGMELSYNHGFTENQFNGNIAGIKWKSTGSDKQRAYGFAYDNANRLLKGDFTQYTSGWNTSAGVDYSMKMGNGIHADSAYDANGNILKMWQKGLKLTTSSVIDDLNYNYLTNSNKLFSVTEQSLGTTDNKLGDFTDKNTSNDDYNYDANGNLIIDKNKAITAITYNHLNLPQSITITSKGTITYTYDAAGNKLKKVTVDNTVSPSKTTTTYYVSGFVYEQMNTGAIELQFFGHEEGRVRKVDSIYVFDYMIKDHLGNVRMVLSDEQKTDTYLASSEDELYEPELQLFVNYENIVEKPECFDENSENTKVQIVGAANGPTGMQIVGVGKVLKVMAGDKVNAQVFGWFSPEIGNEDDPSNLTPIHDLLLSLFGQGLTGAIGETPGNAINSGNFLSTGIDEFLATQDNYNINDGAYLNWILLDEEQLKLVQNNSGFVSLMQTADTDECGGYKKLLQINEGEGIEIKKNGYLYIYVSNTNVYHPVYFDDLQIEHLRGSLIEETHYYPFGLTMQGISSKALPNTPTNRYKYNGKEEQREEFSDGSGLEWMDYGARMYDGQIGRWNHIDPLANKREWLNPYNYCQNIPILRVDSDGNLDGIFDEQKDGSWKKREGVKNDGGDNNHTFIHKNGDVSYYTGSTGKVAVVKAGSAEKKIKEYKETKAKINEVVEKTGSVINNIGDGIALVGYVAAPFTGGTSLVLAGIGEGISVTGSVIEHSAKISKEGFTRENVTDIAIDAAFEIAPKPLEMVIEKSKLDVPAKKIIKAQVNKVNMGVEFGVKEKKNNK